MDPSSKDRPKDGWNPDLNQDEAIIAQERLIEKEIAEKICLIGAKCDLMRLSSEYPDDDNAFQEKIKDLRKRYQWMRKTRPDGNCFFRAFTFAYFESLLQDEPELTRFITVAEKSKEELISLGFPNFTIEDFHECFYGVLNRIKSGEISTSEQLQAVFNDQGISDYLVVFMRLVTSGHLRSNEEFFSNFIEGEKTVKEFCSHEVEPMYKESDHIHIIALTAATKVPVCINYLDRGQGGKVTVHNFPEGSSPRIHLLYRPGHYDILYLDSIQNGAVNNV
ncbi:ubiquitin thioesterase OTUB1-like isoform X1 [Dinothrombium tinctorium]|uniref:Ubiquitin thioesterase n=1 Tax=Dinothrombium tinctorium TaxID=1965070 RepID=A0A443QAU0_9ACAR|nr:ubiquitin thioesterase OTUB1-like isoform X1 [Dinothrombium tinctorium]